MAKPKNLYPNGARIRSLMEARGWSQLDLHYESGLARGTIENCTRDKPRSCYARSLKKLADTLGVDFEELRASGPCCTEGGAPEACSTEPVRANRPLRCSGHLLPKTGSAQFVGREHALDRLTEAWLDPEQHVMSVVAIGGQGKTALVKHWLDRNKAEIARTAGVLVWSFDGQGRTHSETGQGSEALLATAWNCLFGDATMPKDWHRCAGQVAERLAEEPLLLVLDGIEVLQTEAPVLSGDGVFPTSEPLLTLLRHLAHANAGLCLVTSRYPLIDLGEYRGTSAPELRLPALEPFEARGLFDELEIDFDAQWLDRVIRALGGHPLSLYLLTSYLAGAGVDPDTALGEQLLEADREDTERCAAIVSAYQARLDGTPEYDLLRLLSLFDAPVSFDAVAALVRAPVIDGLTDALGGLRRQKWQRALKRLADLGLVEVVSDHGDTGHLLHPVVRNQVRVRLEASMPVACREAHVRIYRWSLKQAPKEPVRFNDLAPLYRALAHGLAAGLHAEVFDEVVWKRLLQGYAGLALQKFSAGRRDLGAVGGFFDGDPPDPNRPRVVLDCGERLGRLYWWAGLVLQLNARFEAAIRFFDAAERAFVDASDVLSVPVAQLSKRTCLLYLGEVNRALQVAETAMAQLETQECDISRWARDSTGYVMGTIAKLILQIGYRGGQTVPLHLRIGLFNRAEVLHAAGRLDEAGAAFESAFRSPLPIGAREWEMFLVQDGWYLEFLLSTAQTQRARAYLNDVINAYQDSPLAEAIAAIGGARLRIDDLDSAEQIDDNARRMERMANALDVRTRHHLIRGLLEFAAHARGLHELGLAESLLDRARTHCRAANIGLLEVDCLLEEGWIRLGWGELQVAVQLQIHANERIEASGYRLRIADAIALGAAIGRAHR